jgi:tetratricopeptide (TPR) repeat protein
MTYPLSSSSFRLFAAGIAKCPQHVPLYQAWACLELRSGDVLTAKRLIGEALTRNKRNGSGWLVAAKIEEKMGNTGLVGLILRRGIECAPGNPELYRALAEHDISRMKMDSVSSCWVFLLTCHSIYASHRDHRTIAFLQARELLEKGIESNPRYAPLYHSLAELEARVFNIDGLAKLNKRLATIFPSDGNASFSQQSWGNKMKLQHSSSSSSAGKILPDGVAALAQKIGVDGDAPTIGGGSSLVEDDLDPETLLNSICGFSGSGDEDVLMFQDMPNIVQAEDAEKDAELEE